MNPPMVSDFLYDPFIQGQLVKKVTYKYNLPSVYDTFENHRRKSNENQWLRKPLLNSINYSD